ncbi:hypothetical protein L348_09238 [Enterobacter sp. MGH 2]|uniref:hypothetical protein n=1 Tax=Enterobacter cloacae complex TaxID=354276 RepID=UPI00044E172E|nr:MULTISPECIES: hypothetical protein [Enterobacter cloacae complex]HDT2265838.1 hypothetical protein [Enterobacter asburiae]EHF5047926.1 hypothetical protein [Enterobacter hormaechei]EHF5057494.1 hypothetical protein [Enterobacter hormaechei]EHF8239674.1 hypothetical protein [Enterobacter hormaechei]EUM99783.1 hypothetical protein L348_09238 [Enterobacter sp. MGH 2]
MLKICGFVVLALGVICIIMGLDMDVTVSSGAQMNVYNTGLIASRQMTISIGCSLLVTGAILLSGGVLKDAIIKSALPHVKADTESPVQQSQFVERMADGSFILNEDAIRHYADKLHKEMPDNTALSVMVTNAPHIERIKSGMPSELAKKFERQLETYLQAIK